MSLSRNEGEATENDIVVTAQLPQGSALCPAEISGPDQSVAVHATSGQVRFRPLPNCRPEDQELPYHRDHFEAGPISLQAEAVSRRQIATDPWQRDG